MIESVTLALFPYAVAWFVALMAIRTGVVIHRGYRRDLGPPKGDPRRGVLYSLSFSMLPWKKDSTRRHPWTYAFGVGMHVALLSTFVFAVGRRYEAWPAVAVPWFGLVAGVGFVSALGLFIKRSVKPYMRAISSPDDFVSNFVVELYLLGGCLTAFFPQANGFWRLSAILLLLYVPLGKIYHMVLFFVSRALFGLQFGRRGVLRHDFPVSY